MGKRLLVSVFAAAVLAYAVNSLIRIATTYAPDFSVFYEAARGLLAHQNIYQLPLYTGLGYPPFTLIPFVMLTFIPYPIAQGVWICISFVLFVTSMYVSLKLFRKNVSYTEFAITFILGFLAFPTRFSLGMGQVNFVALSLFLLSILLIKRKSRIWAGIALGLLFIVKPHFMLFVPVFMLAGQWVALLIATVVVCIGIFGTGIVFGWDNYLYYFQTTLPQLLVFTGRGIYYNQGLGGSLSRLLPTTIAGELTGWISVLLLVSALWFIWNKRLRFVQSLLLFIPVFLLVEPLSWQHHYVFLLPVYIWLAGELKKGWLLALYAVSFVLVAMNFPAPPVYALSHVFFGTVLLLSLVIHETA